MNALPIINYHGIETRTGEYPWTAGENVYVLTRRTLQDHLSGFQKEYQTLKQDSLRRWLNWEIAPAKPLILTFDDGHISHYTHAFPELKNHGMTALFFISAGLVGKDHYMNWDQLKELAQNGFEIGSHGMNHVPLTGLSQAELQTELADSKKLIEERLGGEVISFSVPRGFANEETVTAAKSAGYEFVFHSTFDINLKSQDPSHLNRMAVKKTDTLEEVLKWTQGDLGSKRLREEIKAAARKYLPASWYDRLAGVKRVIS